MSSISIFHGKKFTIPFVKINSTTIPKENYMIQHAIYRPQNTPATNLVNVRNVTTRLARKSHVCNFSGREINTGELYYEISYLRGDDHRTYRVHRDELIQFIKEKVWMEVGKDFDSMAQDLSKAIVNPEDTSLITKNSDVPGVIEKLTRLYNRAQDVFQNLR